MVSYTFKIITDRKKTEDKLFDLFLDTIVDVKGLTKYEDIVEESEEARLDLISKRIYGSKQYVEELMLINNILNPFSIVAGQTIYYLGLDEIKLLRRPEQEFVGTTVAKQNKSTRKDPTRQKGVPPTIKPMDFEQIMVDKKGKTIKLNTRLS